MLVVQPGEDELVDSKNAEAIHQAAGDPKQLTVIDGADHLFTQREDETSMIDVSREWFERWLRSTA